MSPLYVRPYVKVHKTDDLDAEAIAEAATRPTMSLVTLKSPEQLDLQALHRARERLVQNWTRLVNQARGYLMERGIRIGTGRHVFQRELTRLLEDDDMSLRPSMVCILSDTAAELTGINERVAGLDAEFRSHARHDADMQRLMEIPGAGPTIATALVAAIGDGSSFNRARGLSAWLGLVPRQITTGGKARLIGIPKHGKSYLRKLFIHGARTVLHLVRDRSTPLVRWVDAQKERAHANVAGVAMANKLARIAWAVLTKGERYRPSALGQRNGPDGRRNQGDLRARKRWTNDLIGGVQVWREAWPARADDLMRRTPRDFPSWSGATGCPANRPNT